MTDRIRQISRPQFNPKDGFWYNRDRVLIPDSSGAYKIAEENVYRSHGPNSDAGLPQPWTQNVDRYLDSKSSMILANLLSFALNPAARSVGVGTSLYDYMNALDSVNAGLKGGGDPLAGTVYDVEYNRWPGTDRPWDQSTRWP